MARCICYPKSYDGVRVLEASDRPIVLSLKNTVMLMYSNWVREPE